MPMFSLSRNECLILQHIRQNGPTAQSGLALAAGLSAQAVSNISRGLIDYGLLRKKQVVRGKVGQPSVPLALDPEGAFFFGLKIGRRLAELALVDFTGEVRVLRQEMMPHPDPNRIVTFTRHAISSIRDALAPGLRARIAGLGIAVPFRLWDWGDDYAAWRGFELMGELAAEMPFPVFLENDASAACGAELLFGARDLPPDFASFYVAHFVGGGLVLDGHLRLGPRRNAAAFGSLPAPGGGQLLDVASVATLEQIIGRGLPPDDSGWDPDAAQESSWLDAAAGALAFAAASMAAACDLSAIVIDGAVPAYVRSALAQKTQAALQAMPSAGFDLPELREGTLGRRARVLGAAALPLAQLFLPDRI